MQRTLLLVALAASLALACTQGPDGPDYQVTMLMLPEGEKMMSTNSTTYSMWPSAVGWSGLPPNRFLAAPSPIPE